MKSLADEPEEKLCRKTIEERAAALVDELTSLRRRPLDDSIHDTRVASRRLRAALEAFRDRFPPRPWRSLHNRVREITKTLGRVREAEVNLALLTEMAGAGDMAENLCREYLQEQMRRVLRKRSRRLKRNLRKLDPDRIRAMTDFLLAGLGESVSDTANHVKNAEASFSHSAPGTSRLMNQPTLFPMRPPVWEKGRRIMQETAQPILAFRIRYGFRRATDRRLHKLRIAAKKLRYAMEIFDPVWPGGLEKKVALARVLQDAGGNYHDWCMLRNRIQREIRRLTKQETSHLAFQVGRLLSQADDRRLELRKKIGPVISHLQAALEPLLTGSPQAPAQKRLLSVKTHKK